MGKKTNKKQPKALGVDGLELFDITCFSCKKNQKNIQDGKFHCRFCGVMCENCAGEHQKTPKKSGHWADKIKLLSHYEPPEIPTFHHVNKCEIHSKRRIKSYCLDHGALCCKECVRDFHADCVVEELHVMCENISKERDIVEARNELTDLKRRSNMTANSKKKEIVRMAKQAADFETYVKELREKINMMFDNMVAAILKEKEEFCKAETELILKDVEKLDNIIPIVDTASKSLNQAFSEGKREGMWIAMKKVEAVLTHYDEDVTNIENDKNEVKFQFIANASLQGILGAPENMGRLKITSSRLHGKNTDMIPRKIEQNPERNSRFKPPWSGKAQKQNDTPWMTSTNLHSHARTQLPDLVTNQSRPSSQDGHKTTKRTVMTRTPVGLYTPKEGTRTERKYGFINDPTNKVRGDMFGPTKDVKLTYIGRKEIMADADPELTSITASAFLPNGRLVLVDNHNKTLKLFSAAYEFLAGVVLDERPWNVTSCYKTVVAVSYPYDKSVEIITTGMEMKIDGKIKTDRPCHGMGFHKVEKWLYIVCGSGKDAQIQAYSLDGYLRKVIIPKVGVLHEPCYLVMTSDSSRLFISDLENGIVGFDTRRGDVICQYKDPNIQKYWDLKIDSDGRLFVVTTDPDCIYVLMGEHNGQLVKEFLSGNKPCSISYSPVNKDLVVTRWKVEELEVFRFV
ncbi:hypothetical protein MAR_024567 [Mya arenaria]|uniref:B box-type domain-containing protein n=1 Tax=Mya arenaria TaxID=6604 RepID=A0ABY7DS22_MYAAR|nr:uncharacterized protein LOC128229207 [Mya arenaria]WAR00195.1 hypothetical protein MAR_024567 [Mya arenaria]